MTPPVSPDARPQIEGRLRDALAAEAGRQVVEPDLATLWSRADEPVGELVVPGRGSRSRFLVAAAVVGLLVAGVGVVAVRDDGDQPVATGEDDQPVDTDATATGWYLPGDGWEVTGMSTASRVEQPGLARTVLFLPPDPTPNPFPQLTIEVFRTTERETLAQRLVRPAGGVAPSGEHGYLITEAEGGSAPFVMLAAPRQDAVLSIQAYGLDAAAVEAIADQWWDSGGRAIVTPDGLTRVVDTTITTQPVTADEAVPGGEEVLSGSSVGVEVRGPAGQRSSYSLTAALPGLPTGHESKESARAAGLSAAEAPQPIPTPVPGGRAWLTSAGSGAAAELPGAAVTLNPSDDPTGTVVRDLLAALRPVSAQRWRDAVNAVVESPDPALLAPTLTDAPVPDLTDRAGTPTSTASTTTGSSAPGGGPELVPVEGPDHEIAGYARREDIYPTDPGRPPPDVIPVYDETGETLRGHTFPNGVGYISLEDQRRRGVSPDDPPPDVVTPTTVGR